MQATGGIYGDLQGLAGKTVQNLRVELASFEKWHIN
jgi:hypothetical protein